jgi:hypothetical protein
MVVEDLALELLELRAGVEPDLSARRRLVASRERGAST